MSDPNPESEPIPQVVFRAGKKRKPYRQRAEEPDPETATAAAADKPTETTTHGDPKDGASATTDQQTADQDDAETRLPVAEVLKLRNARKHKLTGVEFRAEHGGSGSGDDFTRATSEDASSDQRKIVLYGGNGAADPQQSDGATAVVLGGISERFAPQTGLVGELVNKHMEEYVESELARRKRLAADAAAKQQQQQEAQERQRRENDGNTSNSSSAWASEGLPIATGGTVESQRVLQGRLLEVDLGDETRARNIAMTEQARRRLQGQIDEEEARGAAAAAGAGGDQQQRGNKVRIGRDGKPIRSSRNRRGSDDITRDQLVEQFLSENKIDLYDTQSAAVTEPPVVPDAEDVAADDRIAEEFRREFFDALAQRHRRKRVVNATRPGPKKAATEEILRGPKLGGSRNDRALMREKLLEEQRARKQQQQRAGRR